MILDLEHYVTPHLEYDKPNIAVIHIGSKNVSYNGLNIDGSILAKKIIKIGNKCIDYGVNCLFHVSLKNFILFQMLK